MSGTTFAASRGLCASQNVLKTASMSLPAAWGVSLAASTPATHAKRGQKARFITQRIYPLGPRRMDEGQEGRAARGQEWLGGPGGPRTAGGHGTAGGRVGQGATNRGVSGSKLQSA